MKAEELKTKTGDELNGLLVDLKKEQLNLRFQLTQGQLENTARIRAVRRDIARVQTFLNAQGKPEAAKKAAPKKAKEKTEAATEKKTAAKKPAKKKSAA